jgi:hypothetical protein
MGHAAPSHRRPNQPTKHRGPTPTYIPPSPTRCAAAQPASQPHSQPALQLALSRSLPTPAAPVPRSNPRRCPPRPVPPAVLCHAVPCCVPLPAHMRLILQRMLRVRASSRRASSSVSFTPRSMVYSMSTCAPWRGAARSRGNSSSMHRNSSCAARGGRGRHVEDRQVGRGREWEAVGGIGGSFGSAGTASHASHQHLHKMRVGEAAGSRGSWPGGESGWRRQKRGNIPPMHHTSSYMGYGLPGAGAGTRARREAGHRHANRTGLICCAGSISAGASGRSCSSALTSSFRRATSNRPCMVDGRPCI